MHKTRVARPYMVLESGILTCLEKNEKKVYRGNKIQNLTLKDLVFSGK